MASVTLRSECPLVRARSGSHRHVVVQVDAAKLAGAAARLPMNLAFVLDRSGSMGGGKFEFARGATLEGISRLKQQDRFAVVVYDVEVDTVVPSTLASPSAARAAKEALERIGPRGGTDLCSGWLTGCREIAQRMEGDQVARACLFTDGQANHGETDPTLLARHAAELRARGIVTSTFGIGLDFDEHLLRTIADAGGGNARFIESNADFARLLREELGDAADVVHRAAGLHVAASEPGVSLEVIGPWVATRDDRGTRIALGDLVSEERVEFTLRVHIPEGAEGSVVRLEFGLSDREGDLAIAPAAVEWRRAAHAENDRQPRDLGVQRFAAARHADRARERGILANRQRDYGEARRLLNRVADRIAAYAGQDPELRGIVDQLRKDADRYGQPMDLLSQKQAYYGTSASLRQRSATGSAKRSTGG